MKKISLLLMGIMILAMGSLHAVEPAAGYLGDINYRPNLLRESAGAIFGRVFGVQDERIQIDYHVFELSNHTPANATVRSVLVPGWGQAFNGEVTKGVLTFSLFAAATTGSILLYNESQNSYDDYKNDGLQNGSKYDDYKSQRTESIVLGGMAAGIWLFSIFDAHHNAYTPMMSENTNLQLAFIPDSRGSVSPGLEYRRRF